jgi:hypothetical protein
VVDLERPALPRPVGTVALESASGVPATLTVAGQRAYVATQEEVFVVDVGAPATPRVVGRLPVPAAAVLAVGDLLFAGENCEGRTEAPSPCSGAFRVFTTSEPGLTLEVAALALGSGACHHRAGARR